MFIKIFPDELNFNSWAKQNVRVFHSDGEVDVGIFTELSFDLGPLPPFTEVITQYYLDSSSSIIFSFHILFTNLFINLFIYVFIFDFEKVQHAISNLDGILYR